MDGPDWRQQEECEQRMWEEEFGQAPAVDRCIESKGTKMAFMVSDTGGGGDFKKVPAGTHIGRCFRLVDLGTQEVVYKGDHKQQRKIMVSWELFGEDDEGQSLTTDDGMPLVISKRYTSSLSDKARLRADLEAWRGRGFTDDELRGFDVEALLGKFCMINVIHNTNDAGKTYANIVSITPIPGALRNSLPKGVHEIQCFTLDRPDMALFDSFYDKLKEVIQASAEWRAMKGSGTRVSASPTDPFDVDSDVPF